MESGKCHLENYPKLHYKFMHDPRNSWQLRVNRNISPLDLRRKSGWSTLRDISEMCNRCLFQMLNISTDPCSNMPKCSMDPVHMPNVQWILAPICQMFQWILAPICQMFNGSLLQYAKCSMDPCSNMPNVQCWILAPICQMLQWILLQYAKCSMDPCSNMPNVQWIRSTCQMFNGSCSNKCSMDPCSNMPSILAPVYQTMFNGSLLQYAIGCSMDPCSGIQRMFNGFLF
ncbi:hypothetical protein CEXT_374681 [Caerostris extrusa]|uniref:Uncharacterized protein n=1 Tax=Caerostris extrusa TaxID=172846 RepID=A0AAV4MVM9_CAEEX|nr:hypothetical protein CEXT_374681 [Caerostris extrusa]